jgi:hypothetical protein
MAAKAEKAKRHWRELHGMLKGKGNSEPLSITEINEAIAEGGAAAGMAGLHKVEPKPAKLIDQTDS